MQELREKLIVVSKEYRKLKAKKQKFLEQLQKRCRCVSVIAYYRTSGDILTYCICCGALEENPFSNSNIKDLKKRKNRVQMLDWEQFSDKKFRIFKKLGIE